MIGVKIIALWIIILIFTSMASEYGQKAYRTGSAEILTETPEHKKKPYELRLQLESYISGYQGVYGVYFIDIKREVEFGINEKVEFYAASTVKVPLNLYLYELIEQGIVNPYETLKYTDEDYEGGTGKIKYREKGAEYTVRQLSRLSITISDNIAANMLLRKVGRKNLKEYMRMIGGKVVSDEKNISCPEDMAVYLKHLYEFYSDNETLGKELADYLSGTVFNERIPLFLPDRVKVAHKIGNWHGEYHDVGIVFSEDPYIVSVMSKNVPRKEEAFKVISDISAKIYRYMNK